MTTVLDIQRFKREGRRFAMLTAYDHSMARILDSAGIPVLLVGDSLGTVFQGQTTTLPVTLEQVIYHAQAVVRGVTGALVVGDLPFLSYQVSTGQAVMSAGRLMKEGGVHAVKLEGAASLDAVAHLTAAGIPVMGHLGLTPQSVHALGGNRVQGRSDEAAEEILAGAQALERAGAFALVLEAVPAALAARVTQQLRIPTIGIGAGPHCDGQVLVVNDMLGLSSGHTPRFVRRYAELGDEILRAATRFAAEVDSGAFPDAEHSYPASPRVTERRG